MNGILLVDKEQDWTSSDVVAKLRGVLHEKRIGHAGTLDPMATGLLVLFVGRATRAAEYASSHEKRYLAELRLGLTTDTQDIWGTPLRRERASVGEEELRAVLRRFTGEIEQIPPMYSAVKHHGRKLYEIARRGGEVEREPRPVRIDALELLGGEGESWRLDVRCSKGTYIRTLCHDIGRALGCGACMSALRRVEHGQYAVSAAHTVSEIEAAAEMGSAEELLLPVDSLFSEYPPTTVSGEAERRIRCGAEADAPGVPDGLLRLYAEDGAFLALARAENERLRTEKSFFEVQG
ncbi:MAG: tRNA pseudouridine(55) synthase TruB [Oscillospiraceae bacterium]|nr:tRNA pseudouridine(55) synthase TruB [Oscillospiraceae bacterium]